MREMSAELVEAPPFAKLRAHQLPSAASGRTYLPSAAVNDFRRRLARSTRGRTDDRFRARLPSAISKADDTHAELTRWYTKGFAYRGNPVDRDPEKAGTEILIDRCQQCGHACHAGIHIPIGC